MTDVITIERIYGADYAANNYIVADVQRSCAPSSPRGSKRSGSSSPLGTPQVQIIINKTFDQNVWNNKLDQMQRLRKAWDSYGADAPSDAAIITARGFLSNLLGEKCEPSRVAPSVVGGVGITHKKAKRRVYVEFYNNGEICALFSDNETPPKTRRIKPGYDVFRALVSEIKDYLDG